MKHLALGTLLLVALSGGNIPDATAAIWTESGDAGELPDTAQFTAGPGPLDAIEGFIATESDQDMFLIVIEDPASFSASTNNLGTNLPVDNDTQLFLFDAQGFGVLANDDDPNDAFTFLAAVPVGSFSGPPGTYLLAISIFDNDPLASGGEIFPDDPVDGVVGPLGPGGASAISAWDFDPFPPDAGPYRIELTGVIFAPELRVSSAGTLATLFAFLWLCQVRRFRDKASSL